MRLVALLFLFLLPAVAGAQPITSFEPDTTSRAARGRTPPDVVSIPVWLGWQIAPARLATSRFDRSDPVERHSGRGASVPWIGVNGTWPWASNHQGWFDAGYAHWRFVPREVAVPFSPGGVGFTFVGESIALDGFTIRSGVDQLVGRAAHPWAALGVGLGLGMGWLTRSSYEPRAFISEELVAHVRLYVQPSPTTRFSLGVSGALVSTSGGDVAQPGVWAHVEPTLRIESALRVPKRIVPGL